MTEEPDVPLKEVLAALVMLADSIDRLVFMLEGFAPAIGVPIRDED
jgi:hypothetical protein